jgi:hypothetical protein
MIFCEKFHEKYMPDLSLGFRDVSAFDGLNFNQMLGAPG